jgi:hypothetical protein
MAYDAPMNDVSVDADVALVLLNCGPWMTVSRGKSCDKIVLDIGREAS